jgi:hypothetical protein
MSDKIAIFSCPDCNNTFYIELSVEEGYEKKFCIKNICCNRSIYSRGGWILKTKGKLDANKTE